MSRAASAGAVAVLVINNQNGTVPSMTGDLSTFGIPAAMVGQADGSILKLSAGLRATIRIGEDRRFVFREPAILVYRPLAQSAAAHTAQGGSHRLRSATALSCGHIAYRVSLCFLFHHRVSWACGFV